MNVYQLSRAFWDYSFENTGNIKPNHIAVYFFAIEHCNRLGWKKQFGFPTSMVLDAIGIKSYSVYKSTLDDLVRFGFIDVIEYSKNQYSSNIIALKEYNKAHSEALSKAIVTHLSKHSESTCESIDSIDKPITILPINQLTNLKRNEIFFLELGKSESWIESVAMKNKIKPDKVKSYLAEFNLKLSTEIDEKNNKSDYASHFSRWVTAEIAKPSNTNKPINLSPA